MTLDALIRDIADEYWTVTPPQEAHHPIQFQWTAQGKFRRVKVWYYRRDNISQWIEGPPRSLEDWRELNQAVSYLLERLNKLEIP
jgi:hypothetical protein